MDDSSVSSTNSAPLNAKSAYVLFYCREKSDLLNEVLNHRPVVPNTSQSNGKMNGNGNKRGRDSDIGTSGSPISKKNFAGPQLPSPSASASPRLPTVVTTAQYSQPQPNNLHPGFQQSVNNQNKSTNSRVQSSPYGQAGSNTFGKPYGNGSPAQRGAAHQRGGFNKSTRGGGKVRLTMVGTMKSRAPRVLRD